MIRTFVSRLKPWQTRLASETDAVLSFEWVLLVTLLTIGIVSGLSAARDAIIDELGDVAQAAQAFDQSYSLAGIEVTFPNPPGTNVVFTAAGSEFTEDPNVDQVFQDCGRTDLGGPTQGPQEDLDS